jgi:hypothetical protein
MFDPDTFLSQSVEGELDTTRPRSEPGEYQATIISTEARSFYSEKKQRDYFVLDVFWDVDDEAVKAITDQDTNQIRQTIFLDISDTGGLDMGKGKNIGLGKLREAVGQNQAGPWSPSMLNGQRATVRVEQDDAGYTNVTGATTAAV